MYRPCYRGPRFVALFRFRAQSPVRAQSAILHCVGAPIAEATASCHALMMLSHTFAKIALVAVLCANLATTTLAARASTPSLSAPIAWTIDPSPQPTTGNQWLSNVACPAVGFCFAVGTEARLQYDAGRTVLQRFDGAAWSVVADAAPLGVPSSLRSISCVTTADCYAVGYQMPTGNATVFMEHWDGASWSVVSLPTIAGASRSYLSDVACANATNCMAVGRAFDAQNFQRALALSMHNGVWTVSSVPSTGSPTNLLGVSCPNTIFCVAAGNTATLSSGIAIPHSWAVRWNGTTWASTFLNTVPGGFSDVACLSPTDCTALDSVFASGAQSIIRRWDGSNWSSLAGPAIAGRDMWLFSISCSVNPCVLAGESRAVPGSGPAIPIVATYDGAAWDIDHLDVRPGGGISGIACPAMNECVAVGQTDGANQSSASLLRGLTAHQTAGETSFSVAVPWTATEDARLIEMATYVGVSPEQMQHDAVGVVAYLVGLIGDPNPVPVSLPTRGSANTRVSLWSSSDVSVLASVRSKFVLDDVEAHRFAVGIVSFLFGLGGH